MKNFLNEPPYIPSWAMNYNETVFYTYYSSSMASIFKPGDLLCARKSALKDVKVGDVVIVERNNGEETEYIVHRVVAIEQAGLITKGDNNLNIDAQIVTKDNFVGLVTSFSRKNRVYSVKNGMIGLFYARLIQTRNFVCLLIRQLGWRTYRFVRQSGLVAYVWHPTISRVRVMTNEGPLIKYRCYGRTVASWYPRSGQFTAIKPFDLIISDPKDIQQ